MCQVFSSRYASVCVIVKHANPCGVAQADDLLTAYHLAHATRSNLCFWWDYRIQPDFG